VPDLQKMVETPLSIGTVFGMEFSPAGGALATGAVGAVILRDVGTGGRIRVLATEVGRASRPATSLTYSPDGEMVAAAFEDGVVRLWRVGDGVQPHRFEVQERVNAISFSPDGMRLSTSNLRDEIRIWSPVDGGLTATLEGQLATFGPDSDHLVVGSRDATIRLVRISDGAEVQLLANPGSRAQRIVIGRSGETVVAVLSDRTIGIWSLADGALLARSALHPNDVKALALSPDARVFATATSPEPLIRVWRTSDAQLLGEFTGHTRSVSHLAFSPDGRVLASASADGTIGLWGVR
jgi:WD40 repeat protein